MPDGSKPMSETAAETAQPQPNRRRRLRRLLMIGGPLAVLIGVGIVYLNGGRYADTDNAYVHTHKVSVSADISGRVVDLKVHENQPVKKGDVLFQLDPEPLQIAVDQARANVEDARNKIIGLKAAYRTRQEDLKAAEANVGFAQRELQRREKLVAGKIISQSDYDEARNQLQRACERSGVDPAGHLAHHLRAGRQSGHRSGSASELSHGAGGAGRCRAQHAARHRRRAGRRRGGAGRCAAARRLHQCRRAGVQHRQPAGRLDRGQPQGDRPHLCEAGPDGGRHHRHLSGAHLHRRGRQHRHGDRRRVQRAAGAERQRQLGQGGAAHPGAPARHRPARRRHPARRHERGGGDRHRASPRLVHRAEPRAGVG